MRSARVEVWLAPRGGGISAGAAGPTRLTDEQLASVQATVTQMIAGFRPAAPPAEPKRGELGLESVEIELGFKLEVGAGELLRVILVDGKAEASMTVKVTWKAN